MVHGFTENTFGNMMLCVGIGTVKKLPSILWKYLSVPKQGNHQAVPKMCCLPANNKFWGKLSEDSRQPYWWQHCHVCKKPPTLHALHWFKYFNIFLFSEVQGLVQRWIIDPSGVSWTSNVDHQPRSNNFGCGVSHWIHQTKFETRSGKILVERILKNIGSSCGNIPV